MACALEVVSFTGFLHRLLPLYHVLIYCPTCPSVYTVAVQVSSSNQNFSLQVDTGSSDLVGICPINRSPCAHLPLFSGLHQHLARQVHVPIPRGGSTTLRFPVLPQVMTLT
jgi:hypothetical protein